MGTDVVSSTLLLLLCLWQGVHLVGSLKTFGKSLADRAAALRSAGCMLWLQMRVVGLAWPMIVTFSGKISTRSRCPTWHDTVVFGATISEFEVLVQRLASAYLRFYTSTEAGRPATKFAAQPKYFKISITGRLEDVNTIHGS